MAVLRNIFLTALLIFFGHFEYIWGHFASVGVLCLVMVILHIFVIINIYLWYFCIYCGSLVICICDYFAYICSL